EERSLRLSERADRLRAGGLLGPCQGVERIVVVDLFPRLVEDARAPRRADLSPLDAPRPSLELERARAVSKSIVRDGPSDEGEDQRALVAHAPLGELDGLVEVRRRALELAREHGDLREVRDDGRP